MYIKHVPKARQKKEAKYCLQDKIAIKNHQLCDISQNPHTLRENTCTLISHNNFSKKHNKKGYYGEAT